MEKYKVKYNELLKRYNAGTIYIDKGTYNFKELKVYMQIIKALNKLLQLIKDYTQKEIVDGFKIKGRN